MAKVLKSQVVNDAIVLDYESGDYASYLKDKAAYESAVKKFVAWKESDSFLPPEDIPELPKKPEIKNALEGLRIMDISARQLFNLTRSPIETGVYISDCKVRQPNTVSIKGICDNVRGELKYDKKFVEDRANRFSGQLAGIGYSIYDAFTGYSFEATQTIETRARSVYKKIHEMLNDKTMVNGKPKTWMVSTKGSIYQNMILKDVEQLNDWEHLMVVPVTLHFEELIMAGEDATDSVFLSEDDSPLVMSGSMKKGTIFDDWKGYAKATFSFIV